MAERINQDGRRCRSVTSWFRYGVRDVQARLRSGLLRARTVTISDEGLLQDMSSFYAAARAGDFAQAVKLCDAHFDTGNWSVLVSDCIERLNHDWQLDQVSLLDVTEAFWTTNRVLEHMLAQGVPVARGRRATGNVLLSVPEGELHCFGAQVLADKLRRDGLNVDLVLKVANADVLTRLQTQHYDILGFSVGYDQSLLGLADQIAEARMVSANPALQVVVGGNLFGSSEEAYAFLGAERVLTGADEPVDVLRGILSTARRAGEIGYA